MVYSQQTYKTTVTFSIYKILTQNIRQENSKQSIQTHRKHNRVAVQWLSSSDVIKHCNYWNQSINHFICSIKAVKQTTCTGK